MIKRLHPADAAAARLLREQLIQKHRLTIVTVYRNGPRFFVALCRSPRGPRLLKICLQPPQRDPYTNNGVKREIVTLRYLYRHRQKFPGMVWPMIEDYGLVGRGWYLREHVAGRSYGYTGTSFFYKPEFFRPSNRRWVASFLSRLHRLSRGVPRDVRQRFTRRHTMAFALKPLTWPQLRVVLPDSIAVAAVRRWISARAAWFNRQQDVLTHYEPYAPHFLRVGGGKTMVIDWENVDWGNRAHDISLIWCRSFEQTAAGADLVRSFARISGSAAEFWRLFEIEVMVQSLHNIIHFRHTQRPLERSRRLTASRFFLTNIERILAGDFLSHYFHHRP